jgi:hypothetical protein
MVALLILHAEQLGYEITLGDAYYDPQVKMKSVTIKDKKGNLLIKVLHRKNGVYDILKEPSLDDIEIEIRDDSNSKVRISKKCIFPRVKTICQK